jgi:hypothetical protein
MSSISGIAPDYPVEDIQDVVFDENIVPCLGEALFGDTKISRNSHTPWNDALSSGA